MKNPHQLVAEFNSKNSKYKFPTVLLDYVFKIYTKCMQLCEQIDVEHTAIQLNIHVPDYLATIERNYPFSNKVTNQSKKLPVLKLKNGVWSLKLNKPIFDNIAYSGSIFSAIKVNTVDQAIKLTNELLGKKYQRRHFRKTQDFVNVHIGLDSIDFMDTVGTFSYINYPECFILHPGDFL